MDHDSGLDVPGTLEINVCVMIRPYYFIVDAEEGTARS